MSPDLLHVGVNGQAMVVQISAILETDSRIVPTVADYIAAWMELYNSGLLVEIPRPVQPTVIIREVEKAKSEIERQGEIIAREIFLMKAQRRQEASKPTAGPGLRDRAQQIQRDDADWQSFRSEMGTAEAINIIGYQGNISWGQTNDARRVAIEKCKSTWTKKHPEWAGRIEQYNSSVIQPVQQALPDNPTREQMNAVSPEVLRQWLKNKRHANRERLGEPSNDA